MRFRFPDLQNWEMDGSTHSVTPTGFEAWFLVGIIEGGQGRLAGIANSERPLLLQFAPMHMILLRETSAIEARRMSVGSVCNRLTQNPT